MSQRIDLTGKRFGRWTVLGYSHFTLSAGQRKPKWKCRCDCGTEKVVDGLTLKQGGSTSCGCLKRERTRAQLTKHGHSSWKGPRSPTYYTWRGMMGRCFEPNHIAYPHYGGRGITVCERWRDFRNFLADMGERPSKQYTLDRKDSNGHYEPSNCRWATALQQGRNSRKNRMITLDGQTHCLSEWVERLGLNKHTVAYRLAAGWSAERALTEPLHR